MQNILYVLSSRAVKLLFCRCGMVGIIALDIEFIHLNTIFEVAIRLVKICQYFLVAVVLKFENMIHHVLWISRDIIGVVCYHSVFFYSFLSKISTIPLEHSSSSRLYWGTLACFLIAQCQHSLIEVVTFSIVIPSKYDPNDVLLLIKKELARKLTSFFWVFSCNSPK